MMSGYTRQTNMIEGIGNEVLVAVIACVGGLVAILYLVTRSRRQGIHPDSIANVTSTRDVLQNESEGAQGTQRRRATRANNGEATCPICLGSTTYAVETNCGHLFCGHCIITYWQHQTWMGAVRCPSCRTQVTLLLLNFTIQEHTDESDERREVIDKVHQYNRRFSGEPRTLYEHLQDLPTLLRHAFQEFFSVGGLMWMFRFRIAILILAVFLYLISPLDILPEGALGIIGFLDDIFIILLAAIYISILYRQVVAVRAS